MQLTRRLAFLTALCPAIFPTRAEAEPNWYAGVGAFLGASFGAHDGLAWGFELFGTRNFPQPACSNEPRSGVGPLFQFALVGLHDPRVTLALQGGREFDRESLTSITGEVGATYRFGSDPGYGLHMGLTPGWALLDASLRGQLFLDDYSMTAGVRILPPYGTTTFCVVGRPLRSRDGFAPVSERARRISRTSARRADESTRAAGRAWERDAQHECASVPAFLQLAAELLAHDAPVALVERALDAALDEIRHAHSCAAMASRFLGYDVWPSLPDFRRRLVPSLTGLAQESWIDGCVGEGAAAKRAARAARFARDGRTREVQARIARDESRHAELAWDVLRWALDHAGQAARDAVGTLEIPNDCADASDADFREHVAQCSRRRDDLLARSARR